MMSCDLGLMPSLLKYGHQELAEGVVCLLRLPNLVHGELSFFANAGVVLPPIEVGLGGS